MEAHPQTIQQVFSNGGDIQYVLPHFQREYTWERDDWQTLLDDAYATYTEYVTEEREPEHFMGSLVRVSNGAQHGVTTFTLVDGQQRLTTISLLLQRDPRDRARCRPRRGAENPANARQPRRERSRTLTI